MKHLPFTKRQALFFQRKKGMDKQEQGAFIPQTMGQPYDSEQEKLVSIAHPVGYGKEKPEKNDMLGDVSLNGAMTRGLFHTGTVKSSAYWLNRVSIIPRRNVLAILGGGLASPALKGFFPWENMAQAQSLLQEQTHAQYKGKVASSPDKLHAPLTEEQLKVAFCYAGPVTDGGWSMMHYIGLQAAQKAFPRIHTVSVENVPYSTNATRIYRHLVAEGCQMVFACSTYGDFLSAVADRSPDIAFMECDGFQQRDNLSWYYITHWQVGYILGQAAAMMTKTKKLGFVGSFPVPSVICHSNAVLMGARSVDPDIILQVVNINAWFDPQAATQAAIALCDGGCDILFGIMNDAAYLRVAEARNLKAVMWNTDMRRFGPKAYISSTVLDFAPFYISQIQQRLKGEWSATPKFLPLAHGVDRDPWGETVPEEASRRADETRTKMLAGYNPFHGPIKDTKGKVRVAPGRILTDMELYQWDWPVEGVMGLDHA